MAKKFEGFEVGGWNIDEKLAEIRVKLLDRMTLAFMDDDPEKFFRSLQELLDICRHRFSENFCEDAEKDVKSVKDIISDGAWMGDDAALDVLFDKLKNVRQQILKRMYRKGMLERLKEKRDYHDYSMARKK